MRIVAAQLNYHIGHFNQNYKKLSKVIQKHGDTADLIVFSELCLTGYYPFDLIDRASFIRHQNHILQQIIDLSKDYRCAVALGYIAPNHGKGKPFHNSMVVVHQGGILYQYHKQLLPVYNIFDEARHFQPGQPKPCFEYKGKKIAFLICEDTWGDYENIYHVDPVMDFASQKPDCAIILNASPSILGKFKVRVHHAKRTALRLACPLIYVNQVGGNDEIVYDGASFVLDKQGNLLGTLASFEEAVGQLTLEDNAAQLAVGFGPTTTQTDANFMIDQIDLGLKDYLTKAGFKQVVVGISGGIDSAVTLALAVHSLGTEHVKTIFMPTQFTHPSSVQDAQDLAKALGVEFFNYPLQPSFESAVQEFKATFGETPSELTQQNIQARLRGRVLMEYSNHTGAMVLSTGNKSELSVGYTTLYGDMTGGLNLIGDLYKTQVYELAHGVNQRFGRQVIPDHTLTRAPSAELAHHQQDTDSLPAYELLDAILKLYIEGDVLRDDEAKSALLTIKHLDKALIERIHRMVDKSEFKRRQSSPILRLQRRSFGWGRKMPMTAYYY